MAETIPIANISNQDCFTCVDCGQPTNSIWVIDPKDRDTGRCNSCQYKKWLRDMPPPPLSDMKLSTDPIFKGYREWPYNYIPSKCPYCNGDIKSVCVGISHHNDHVYSIHLCENCKIHYGLTD